MTLDRKHVFFTAAALAVAISGTAGLALAGKAPSDTAHCEILATRTGGMVTLEGIVHAVKPLSGSYSLRVASRGGSGSSNISQGGDFTARPGEPATLGQVTLGGSGAAYEATLELKTSAGSFTCRERTAL